MVLALAVVVALCNLYFFTGDSRKNFADQSHAAKFLSNHPQWNKKLAAKNSSIITTVASSGFITQARADDFEGLSTETAMAEYSEDSSVVLSEEAIIKPNPDSIDNLIAKQIKIYETQSGDSLKSISASFGISQQTIMWANKLTSSAIKPGWQLIILPTNGVLHIADNNDTLPDIAKKYSVDMDKIISYNLLDNAEDIEPGQVFIVPDGTMPAPPAPKPQAKPPVKPGTPAKPSIINNGTGHIFPWGYCTWYVATKTHVPWGGNAKNWLANAKSYGAIISKSPAVGSIVVTTDNKRYGHVALVIKVEDDRFLVTEMNYKGFGKVNERWISKTSPTVRGFIHP